MGWSTDRKLFTKGHKGTFGGNGNFLVRVARLYMFVKTHLIEHLKE